MLVSKGYSANDIVCIKIVNGDEIIAKIVEDRAEAFVLDRPCTVMPTAQGIGLVQALFAGDINSSITLDKRHVIMHSPVVSKIQDHYITVTTGIQPVSKGGIIT